MQIMFSVIFGIVAAAMSLIIFAAVKNTLQMKADHPYLSLTEAMSLTLQQLMSGTDVAGELAGCGLISDLRLQNSGFLRIEENDRYAEYLNSRTGCTLTYDKLNRCIVG